MLILLRRLHSASMNTAQVTESKIYTDICEFAFIRIRSTIRISLNWVNCVPNVYYIGSKEK